MKNNYIKIFMNKRNEFRSNASLNFDNASYENVDVKIDTGCGYSSFPVARLGISAAKAKLMKNRDIKNVNIKKSISFGVNDSKQKRDADIDKYRNNMLNELNSITFNHNIIDLTINNYTIGDCIVRISYDRSGNILIGMDILKNMDVHIGTIQTGETVVLLSHQKSTEYIYVDYEPENADYLKGIAGSATYREIIEWIQNKYDVKVRSSEIAQVKDMCGMEKRENYNLGAEGHRVHKVTAERAKLIKEAFKHFRMI